MFRRIVINVLLSVGLMFAGCSTANHSNEKGNKNSKKNVTLTTGPAVISGDRLSLSYEIQNDSENEIWFCDDVHVDNPVDFEIVATLDSQALLIRMRLDLPRGWWRYVAPYGKYVRLMPGEVHTTSVWFDLPVRQQPVFTSRSAHHPETVKEATHLIMQVGYFSGDLPERMLKLVRETEMATREAEKISKEAARLIDEQATEVNKAKADRLMEKADKIGLRRDVQAGEDMMYVIEDTSSFHQGESNELSLPWSYRWIEAECLLTATVNDIIVPYLPPRYLDFGSELPWGRKR